MLELPVRASVCGGEQEIYGRPPGRRQNTFREGRRWRNHDFQLAVASTSGVGPISVLGLHIQLT